MKLYLWRAAPEQRDQIHGVDYDKGLADGRECGLKHEFQTRNCKPIFLTEQQIKDQSAWERENYEYVEIVPFAEEAVVTIVKGRKTNE